MMFRMSVHINWSTISPLISCKASFQICMSLLRPLHTVKIDNKKLDVNFVGHKYVPYNKQKPNQSSRLRNCFVYKRHGCYSTNHSIKEILKAYRSKRLLRKSVEAVDDEDESEDEGRDIVEALNDVFTQIINVNSESDTVEKDSLRFSHMATLKDKNESTSFRAQL